MLMKCNLLVCFRAFMPLICVNEDPSSQEVLKATDTVATDAKAHSPNMKRSPDCNMNGETSYWAESQKARTASLHRIKHQ